MSMKIDGFTVANDRPRTISDGSTGRIYAVGEEILGGVRTSSLGVGLNLYNVPANLDISNGYLKLSTGAGQFLGVDIIYGLGEDGSLEPLHSHGAGDFLSLGSTLRTNFVLGDGSDVVINYNIVIYTANGRAHYAENITPRAFGDTVFDVPFEHFNIPTVEPADLSAVTLILFRFQTWADFVISSFEIV